MMSYLISAMLPLLTLGGVLFVFEDKNELYTPQEEMCYTTYFVFIFGIKSRLLWKFSL